METLKEMIVNNSGTLIDVRSTMEFEMEHIQGAINIPLEEVPHRIEEMRKLQAPYILYCRSGNRSGMAASMLKQSGFTDVYNAGGIEDVKFYMN